MADDERAKLNALSLKDPFYETPSWGLNRAGGGADDNLDETQSVVARTRRLLAYTTYQRSLDLPAVAAGAPILQLVPASMANLPAGTVIKPTAAAIISITIAIKSAVQGEFGIAECLSRGTPTSALTTYAGGVVSMAEGGWRPNQGPCSLIAGFGATNGWSAAPTFPLLAAGGSADGLQLEQAVLPAVIGSSVSWVYGEDDPLIVKSLISDGGLTTTPAGLVLWNQSLAASPAMRVTVRWKEFNVDQAPYVWV